MLPEKTQRKIYLTLLALLGGCMVTSIGMSNVVWPLLLANWVLEGWSRPRGSNGPLAWCEKWRMARESRLLQAIAALFLLHVVGLLWTSSLPTGLHVIERLLPWLVVPLVVLTTRPPEGRARTTILFVYIATVFVVTVIGLVRWLTIPDLPYRDIVPFISHIRFSLNLCVVLFLIISSLGRHHFAGTIISPCNHLAGRMPTVHWIIGVALILWFLSFLLILRSYTAFVVLLVASLVVIFRLRRRWLWLTVWIVAVGGVVAYVAVEYCAYYRLSPLSTEPLKPLTVNGRPYQHLQDGLLENGNYLHNYLCDDELAIAWPQRSSVPLNSLTTSGYSVKAALVRYLNALGLTKDSAGVAALTDGQVEEVGRGVTNPVYEHGSMPQKMLYVIFFEYESYRSYRAVEGFSMLQRYELWRASSHVIGQYPWMGVGTGDLELALEDDFQATQSPLQGSRLMPHNEYLTLIALLGIPAFLLLAFFFLRAAPALRRQPLWMVAWTVAILVSCLTENTLDSLAGILFSTWFMAFRTDSVAPKD